jgi:hypothetical protein
MIKLKYEMEEDNTRRCHTEASNRNKGHMHKRGVLTP